MQDSCRALDHGQVLAATGGVRREFENSMFKVIENEGLSGAQGLAEKYLGVLGMISYSQIEYTSSKAPKRITMTRCVLVKAVLDLRE